jgi:DNA-binding response OmpR family regulator
MQILAYITDLFLESQLAQTAQEAGAQLTVASSLYKFLPALTDETSLVLIDLRAEGISATTLISQLKSKRPAMPILAVSGSNQPELTTRVMSAGADRVVLQSELSEDFPGILAELV